MSARYGDRTRSGDQVADSGRRNTGGGGGEWILTEQEFTSPGTWTKPATVTQVEVIVVGGGGGGGYSADTSPGGGGGGGGVRTAVIAVSGPMPITVGAGGNGGIYSPATSATPGGVSAFGPLGPGPVPAIPANTVAVGGGGAGSSSNPSETAWVPMGTYGPIGGGSGALGNNYYPAYNKGNVGGRYGYACASPTVTSPSLVQPVGAGGAGDTNFGTLGGDGKLGFGYGAPSTQTSYRPEAMGGSPTQTFPNPGSPTGWEVSGALAGATNTGNGGGGGSYPSSLPNPVAAPLIPTLIPGAPGGSGIVIVRYWSAA